MVTNPKRPRWFDFALMIALLSSRPAAANNFHRIDPPEGATVAERKNSPNAKDPNFAIYRTGKPSFEDYETMVCDQGISAIYVLSNNGDAVEGEFNKREAKSGRCPTKQLEVKSFDQNVKKHTLTKGFLDQFDAWVKDAQTKGKKIAFRCNCGCHRTGRLAAYYEMAYMGRKPDEIKLKWDHLYEYSHEGDFPIGKDLYWSLSVGHSLKKQVDALFDYINKKPCSTKEKFCVDMTSEVTSKKDADPKAGDVDPDNLYVKSTPDFPNGAILPVGENKGTRKTLFTPPIGGDRTPAGANGGETTRMGY